jgi:hypothetical protein
MKTRGRLGTPKEIEETQRATKELAQPHWGSDARICKQEQKKSAKQVDRSVTTDPGSR